MTLARQHIIEEIMQLTGGSWDQVCCACAGIQNTTTLGLVAQQIRARRVWLDGAKLRVASWVRRDKLDATSLSAVLAVAREGLPLLAGAVAMVTGWE